MAYFVKIDRLNEESVKINLDLVVFIKLTKDSGRKKVTVYYTDGSNNTFIEGVDVKDAKFVYDKL